MPAELLTRPGRLRRALISAVCAAAVVSIWLSALPAWASGLLTLSVLIMSGRARKTMRRYRIRLGTREASALDGHVGVLRAEAVSVLWAALLLETPDGERYRALVFHDELDREDFRSLLARLRHGPEF